MPGFYGILILTGRGVLAAALPGLTRMRTRGEEGRNEDEYSQFI